MMILSMAISDSGWVIAVYMLSAALHECGHLAAARVMGIGIDEIRFGFSGARIVTDRRLTSYKNELLLAFCGPLVNILVFLGVLLAFWRFGGGGEGYLNGILWLGGEDGGELWCNLSSCGELVTKNSHKMSLGGGCGDILTPCLSLGGACGRLLVIASDFVVDPKIEWWSVSAFLALSSLVQAFFNLLPVKTFDGGRILYCAVAEVMGERVAQRILELSSALSALILWIVALYLLLKTSGGLGIYVFAICIFVGETVKGENGF